MTILIITVLVAICTIVFCYLDQVLIFMGIDVDASRIATHYTLGLLPGLWFIS